MVRAADAALAPIGWFGRLRRSERDPIRRVLLLRLERIGDLLMVLDAIAEARAAWPEAEIDLAVGSWNEPLARLIGGVSRVEVADVPWLAREGTGLSWPSLVGRARDWRRRRYDLVLNFEPDIRSNLLAWLTGARRRFGYWTGGGGALLTSAAAYVPSQHVSRNAVDLVRRAAGGPADRMPRSNSKTPRLVPPPPSPSVQDLLAKAGRPIVGIHASGGRESKQWHPSRFAEVARALVDLHGATIVLTGSRGDRPIVDQVLAALAGVPVIDAAGRFDLPETAALLGALDLLVTGDTGPMHLADAVGTPVVALFGPSDPRRYGPTSPGQTVLRVDLPCSPCGMVRLPPERCRGHVPDCMDGITVARVIDAASAQLRSR
ncbi:MAG TPA: glycosyltransferase family 9 protein [Vicinamibacterales bacterium]|nr:glycosyltransferase family 9 protein [Vicinamibacterales bacterium]